MSNHWDEETDVIILGYGGAGAAVAIAAHDAAAKVGEGAVSGVMAGLARSGPTSQFQMDVACGAN